MWPGRAENGTTDPAPAVGSSPVAFDFLAALLDVSKATAGVALLLVGVVAVPCHVSGLSTVVAQLLSLLLRLLAVSGDVTSSAAVIAGCRVTPGSD